MVDLVRDLSWSPKQRQLAYWACEPGTDIARVTLVEYPSLTAIRKLTFYKVSECKFYWQSEGEYLVVKVEMLSKTKKSTSTSLHLLRLKQKEISVEMLNFEDSVVNEFAWEPKGNYFSITRGEGVNTSVSFYAVEDTIRLISEFLSLFPSLSPSLFYFPP